MSKVYFIGAGPGAPDLLSIRGMNVIKKADVIIYAGSLVDKRIIGIYARRDAKVRDSAKMTLNEVCGIYAKHKESAGIIARIHSGDPSIYGAIQEQMSYCDSRGIPYEVIPGISSFCASAAVLKQELTLPGVTQTVIITRVSGKTKAPDRERLKYLAKIKATLVIFLSVGRIGRVVKELLRGYDNRTPVAVVYKASWDDEKIIKGVLEDISEKIEKERIDRHALIIVGNVLDKRNFKLSKLYDKQFSTMFRKKS